MIDFIFDRERLNCPLLCVDSHSALTCLRCREPGNVQADCWLNSTKTVRDYPRDSATEDERHRVHVVSQQSNCTQTRNND